jgi:hypothetical protein
MKAGMGEGLEKLLLWLRRAVFAHVRQTVRICMLLGNFGAH